MAPPDSISTRSSLPLAAAPMSDPTPFPSAASPPPNPLAAAASFLQHHLSRLASHLNAPRPALAAAAARTPGPQGTSLSLALAPDEVARALTGTPVFTVCNSSNEFVLVSDPATGLRSLGLLCFRSEDADALLSHVRTRQPMLGKGAKVVPITLDQVYMLKAEGIAFRFLPDPLQIKNALEMKSGLTAFDGVPVFQSDLLVVKKQKKRYCPIYFQKEDIERELTRASKGSRGSALSKQIMVGSLEDILKKMEINERNSGWDDLIFIPPGKSLNQHINEVTQADLTKSSGNTSSSPVNAHHDLLLGGLLSPDFDAATCLSRYEASKRWKTPSPFLVSPYLVQKLRQYESNHRRCGLGTANYREAMAQLTSGRNGDRAECRYVVWFPIQGMGNRMLSVVSTFLYALLTGRVLLVYEPPEMEGLFCEPFPGTSWILPPDFPYKDVFWVGSSDSYLHMLENNVVRYDDSGGGGDANALPPYVYFHLEQIQLRLQNHTFCEEDHRVLDRFNWMVLRSDSYFAVALFLMPMYRAQLDLMFPAKASVFHHLGRFYDGYLAGADERLGIQVRLAPFLPLTFEVMYEQITRGTREHGLLPQVTDTSEPGARPSNGTAAKVKAVLVVSLKPEYYDKLHSVYYTNATATGEVVTVYQPSHDQDQHSEAREHNERALAKIFLLSYCDRLVTTGFSTFGHVGATRWLGCDPGC
ncbi:unnamed protein product [Miscanthus lutarioriparius]|uniref:Protein TIC 22, chloroplastic n=1 Tax=Miscanthus lutarioriparius TaxID=422564 RepID=A0A811SM17_9POAL|nr:unnamed protein product [Miscanthus lutarioriparius]